MLLLWLGGSGERFWPKSRRVKPKQLLPIVSNRSMLQETVWRLKGIIPRDKIYVVTNRVQEKLVKEEVKLENIIAEPLSKNTAPCISVAASFIQKRDSSGIMVVLPADQHIQDVSKFQTTIKNAVKIAGRDSTLVTLGMQPRSPHTGYGYIKKGKKIGQWLYKVSRFTEKPDLKTAKRYISTGRYLWNSGMFIWKVSSILEEIERHLPRLYLLTKSGKLNKIYRNAENISIDYGIMEKTDRAVVIETGFSWDDVGSWSSLDVYLTRDNKRNIIKGKVVIRDVYNSTIITDSPLVAAVGVSDIIVVGTKDAVLICPKNRAEEVKNIVGVLKKNRKYARYL